MTVTENGAPSSRRMTFPGLSRGASGNIDYAIMDGTHGYYPVGISTGQLPWGGGGIPAYMPWTTPYAPQVAKLYRKI